MNVALVQVQEGVQPLVNTANFIFIDPATVEQPILPAFTPIVLPPERPVFAALPDKPPDIENAAIRFLNNLNGKFDVAVINSKSSPVIHDADGIKVKPLEKKNLYFFSSATTAPGFWRACATTSLHYYSNRWSPICVFSTSSRA